MYFNRKGFLYVTNEDSKQQKTKKMTILLIICIILIITLLIKIFLLEKDKKKKQREIEKQKTELADCREYAEELKIYEPIKDIERELKRVNEEIELKLEKAKFKAEKIIENSDDEAILIREDATKLKNEAYETLENSHKRAAEIMKEAKKEATETARELKNKAELILADAHNLAVKIEADANQQATEIAGEAWEAKNNAEQYQETATAMKNIIEGYGDEYLIPNHSLLDDLAEEYNHEKAGRDLAQVRAIIKSMVKNDEVAECDYVDSSRRATAIEFIADAFNGKVSSIMSKVRHDNYGKLLQSIKDSFRIVNHNGKAFRNTRITERYYRVMLEQLRLSVTVQEIKKRDLDEQKAIREAIREEEKARRDFERARKEAEREEKMLEKARKEVEAKLLKSADEDRAKFEAELQEIKEKLQIAEENGKRAMSMAQQTKRGHVYVISNIGSFGENVFKIGLTRRLEPMDRIKELGDASVPFSFDVHAMIHSEDAPKLERELHEAFNLNRVNKINYRKEFFSIPISEIKSKIDSFEIETHWTMKAEALEYRESVEMKKREMNKVKN